MCCCNCCRWNCRYYYNNNCRRCWRERRDAYWCGYYNGRREFNRRVEISNDNFNENFNNNFNDNLSDNFSDNLSRNFNDNFSDNLSNNFSDNFSNNVLFYINYDADENNIS